MKKTLSMVLVLAMLMSAMLGIVSFADTEEPELSVTSAAVEFGSSVYLYVAVDCSAFDNSENVSLKITNTKTAEEIVLAPDTSLAAPAGCVAFKYDTFGAKYMGDELLLQPMKDGAANGTAKTYSILEYALLAENLADAKLTGLVKAMINYGANAQIAYNYEGTYDLSVDHSIVLLYGGAKFENGASKAIMAEGDAPLTATKSGAASTDIWCNSRLQKRGTGASIAVNYTQDNESLFVTTPDVHKGIVDYEEMANAVVDGIWSEDRSSADIADHKVTYDKNGNAVGGGNDKWWTKDADGNIVEYKGTKPNFQYVANYGQIAIVHKNQYIEITSDADVYAPVTSACGFRFSDFKISTPLAQIAKDPDAKAFTMSLTVAGGDISSDIFSYFSLRGSGQNGKVTVNGKDQDVPVYAKDANGNIGTKNELSGTAMISNKDYVLADGTRAIPYGRLAFFSSSGNSITTYHNAIGANTKATIASSFGDGSSFHTPGEFVTVHAVFVFETETEGMRIDYYVNDNPNVIASVDIDMMQKSDFLGGGWYIDVTNKAAVQTYLKAFALTSGNIADNFK